MVSIFVLIFYILILLSAWPIGTLLAKLCSDEQVADKKYILTVIILLAVSILAFLTVFRSISMILSLIYMIIVLFILIFKIIEKS